MTKSKVKKKLLKVDNSVIQDKISLYSISSSESDIRICYVLNRILGINLSLADNIILQNKDSKQGFRNFFYESEHGTEKYYFILNRNGGNYLFPELKRIDFVFLIISDTDISGLESIILSIKEQPEISALIPVDPSRIKSLSKIRF